MPTSLKITAAAAAVALFATAGPISASEWTGTRVTKDGVEHVKNPAEAMLAPATVSPEPLWQVGGMDDEDVIFGVVTDMTADDSGTLYLLDIQLNEVMVFSPTGDYLRSIGREGEGPGEFRRPSGLFLTPDGNVAVLQMMPGRIIVMTKGGEPVGNYPVPESADGGMMAFAQAGRAGDHLILDARSFTRKDTGMEITRKLLRINSQGEVVGTLHERTSERSFAGMSFDEKDMNALRWVCGPDGRVYLSDDFDAYRIVVYDPGGSVEHVIERPYEHRRRTPEEIEEHTPHIVFRHRGGGTQTPESHGSKTDRDIISLHPRTDGTLWVLSSRGALDAADGVSFDVFDARGRFEQQVTVAGDASYPEDDLHFVGTRLIVVENSRSALRAYQGGDDEELSDEELENAEPVSLSCYDIGLTRRAAGGSR